MNPSKLYLFELAKRTGLSFQWFPVGNHGKSLETDPQEISVFKPVQPHVRRQGEAYWG